METAVPVAYPAEWDDESFYGVHDQPHVPEWHSHHEWVTLMHTPLQVRHPTWFVAANLDVRWDARSPDEFHTPSLFVVKEPLTEVVDSHYRLWKQPPVVFALEALNGSAMRGAGPPHAEVYPALIRASELLYANPPANDLRLWRLVDDRYDPVAPEANGRLRSVELGLEFAIAGDWVRMYTPEGEMLLAHHEAEAARQQALSERDAVRRLVEMAVERCSTAEQRAADLARRLAELEARLGDAANGSP